MTSLSELRLVADFISAFEPSSKINIADALDDIVELADDISIEKEIHPQNSNLNEDAFESRLSKLGKRKNEE